MPRSLALRRSSRRPPTLVVLLAATALVGLATTAAAKGNGGAKARKAVVEDPGERRIVAIGDIHGAHGALVALLRSTGLIDDDESWAGGDAILVQTGDFLDRGENAVEVARLLRRLQREAPAAGGEVLVLLGNHEVLNLVHRWDDLTSAIVAVYSDEKSEDRREKICKADAPRRRREARNRRDHVPSKVVAFNRCIREHPVGMVEYVEDLEPDGDLGSWLRTLPAVARVGRTVFVHGGITEETAKHGVEGLNERAREELAVFDEARRWMTDRGYLLETDPLERIVLTARGLARAPELLTPASVQQLVDFPEEWLIARPDGILWFRGYAEWDESEGQERIVPILRALDADRVVSGHTPQPGGDVGLRFGGRSALIDTGMLTAVYRGAPVALEISGGGCLASLHLDGRKPLQRCGPETDGPPATGEPASAVATGPATPD